MTAGFTIDSSVLITLARELPRDVHRSAWARLEELIVSGQAFLPKQASVELQRGSDHLSSWIKTFPGFVVEAAVEEIAVVAQIAQDHPDWVQEQQNEADPWMIANGHVFDRVVVTQERRKGPGTADRNLKIPNVADRWDVTCMNFNELARSQSWSF